MKNGKLLSTFIRKAKENMYSIEKSINYNLIAKCDDKNSSTDNKFYPKEF